jgi:uncharacterized protein
MIHPYTELAFINNFVGYGVVANRFIPQGTITWVLDDLDIRITPSKAVELSVFPEYREALSRYGHEDSEGCLILCWDNGRYINHSCDPNCLSPGFEQTKIAIRNIQAGEQISDDYGAFSPCETSSCGCRAMNWRGRAQAKSNESILESQKGALLEAVNAVNRVPQPLWSFVQRFPSVISGFAELQEKPFPIKQIHQSGLVH